MSSNPINRTHKGDTVARVDDYSVIDCLQCGFKHVWPYPSSEALSELYEKSYYSDVYPFSGDISSSEIATAHQVFDERLIQIEERLPQERRKLLDIGAGNCGFLYVARERGWDVLGIEPSDQGKERARLQSIPFICDTFSPETIGDYGPFDLIHLNCVLEHLLDPITLLESCYKSLSPGGLLFICVPNDFNPLQTAYINSQEREPWWVAPLQHINYFDTISLPDLIAKCGFEIAHSETTFPIELFLLFGDNYVSDRSIGSDCHHRITQFETAMTKSGQQNLLKEIYASLEKLNIGRRISVIAKKT